MMLSRIKGSMNQMNSVKTTTIVMNSSFNAIAAIFDRQGLEFQA